MKTGRGLDGAERDLTGATVAELVRRPPERKDGVPYPLRHRPQRLAGGSEPDAPALALEEREAEVPLQLLDVEGDGGLGAPQRAGGGEEGPCLEDRGECFEMSKVHGLIYRPGRTADARARPPRGTEERPGWQVVSGTRTATPR